MVTFVWSFVSNYFDRYKHWLKKKLGDTIAKCERSLLSVLFVSNYFDRYEQWMKYFEKKLGDTMAKCKRSLLSVLLLVIILIDINTG